jgi:hypothetical protein
VITGEYTWNLAVKFGLPLLVLFLLASLLLSAYCVRAIVSDRSGDDLSGLGLFTFGSASVIIACILGIGFVPWAQPFHEYHALNEVRGTVVTATTRLLTNDDGVTQRYVVKFAESNELFACDDSRCSQATPGKQLRLLCTREWQYQAVAGWGCRYGQAS